MSRPWIAGMLWAAAGLVALVAGLAAIQTVRTAVGEPVPQAAAGPSPSPSATPSPSDAPPAGEPTAPAPSAPASAPPTQPAPPASPAPSPSRTAAAPRPSSPALSGATTATLASPGGTVVAECSAGVVRLLAWSPAPGYRVDEVAPGPASEAEVRFENGESRVKSTVYCGAARPEQRVEVSAEGGGSSDD